MAFAASADAAPLGGAHDIQIPLLRLVAAFAICALAALLLALFIKAKFLRKGQFRFGFQLFSNRARSSPSSLAILETRALGPQASISRIAYDDLEFLVLVSAQGASVLHQKSNAASKEAVGP